MFKTKVSGLFKKSVQSNKKSPSVVLSEKGARKYSGVGCPFVEQFSNQSNYLQQREYKDIKKDFDDLYSLDVKTCIKFTIYLRMVGRKTNIKGYAKTSKSQSGGGLKHESICRMLCLYETNEDLFWQNIDLFIAAGCIKDIFTMLKMDLMYHGWDDRKLCWEKFYIIIADYLSNDNWRDLVCKYLPQIKSKNKCRTLESQANCLVAKWLANKLFNSEAKSEEQYRKLKSQGNAHKWQQIISNQKFDELDFSKIHGRALNKLVRSKFLYNQKLHARYTMWADSVEKINYTGFVHELLCELDNNFSPEFEKTVIKQFKESVDREKDDENLGKLVVVRDTSGSMGSSPEGTKYSCYDIAKSLALYFSEFIEGPFKNCWIEFNSSAELHTWDGNNVVEKWRNDSSSYIGSTNFLSVIDLLVRMKNFINDESVFPNGILCISDAEFDPAALNKTNVDFAFDKLRKGGFSDKYVDNFKIVLWNLYRKNNKHFETNDSLVKNVFYLSGYSASQVKFLLRGTVQNAKELFDEAMNQELLDLVIT